MIAMLVIAFAAPTALKVLGAILAITGGFLISQNKYWSRGFSIGVIATATSGFLLKTGDGMIWGSLWFFLVGAILAVLYRVFMSRRRRRIRSVS